MPTPRITVGYDRSADARAAAVWALDEALRTDASVEFVYAFEWPTWAPAASMVPATSVWPDSETELAITEALDDAVESAKATHPAVVTKSSIVHGPAAITLIERSRTASLVVLGSRGHSAVAGLLGSVSIAVSAHARCPVVVVRSQSAATAPIVVGVDDSASSLAALDFAAEQAAGRKVALRVIRCRPPMVGVWEQTPMAGAAAVVADRRSFDELVAQWRLKYPDVHMSAEAVTAHPAAALALASTTAQLLVVGTRGHGAAVGLILGSVSQHVLHHSACTVAVVHER